jgi:hypothetical protein
MQPTTQLSRGHFNAFVQMQNSKRSPNAPEAAKCAHLVRAGMHSSAIAVWIAELRKSWCCDGFQSYQISERMGWDRSDNHQMKWNARKCIFLNIHS